MSGPRGVAIGEIAVLAMIGSAYGVFVAVSEASSTVKVIILIAFAFAFLLWTTARELRVHATASRLGAIGEPDQLIELADTQLARRRSARRRVPFFIYKALAHSMKAEWDEATKILEDIDFGSLRGNARRTWQFLYYNNLLACRLFTGRAEDARKIYEEHVAPFAEMVKSPGTELTARESRAKLLFFEGERDEAAEIFSALTNDIRIAQASRAHYHHFLAAIADDRGDADIAARHRAEAEELAPNVVFALPDRAGSGR